MKKVKVILMVGVLFLSLIFQSCQKNELEPSNQNESILPERFSVDIPNSISSISFYKDANVDTLQGNDIYEHLRNFIYIGEQAGKIVGEIILVISWHNLSQPLSFTYISDDDGRPKLVNIVDNIPFEGYTWQYKMTITDEGSGDINNEKIALQIFWDKNPIKGIAMLNPYNIDRTTDPVYAQSMYRIDYSESGEFGYSHHMIVTIDGLPLENPLVNPYSVSTLKMFVGKKGDVISVYGNSEHPNATFISGETGFDWAFTAAGKESADIGVAEVGLPSNTLNSNDRNELLVENSIKNVFTEQIYALWPWIDSTSIQAFLYNTEAPGFFNRYGFVQGGIAPSPAYNSLVDIIDGLTPYNPIEIHELEVLFD